MKNVRASENFVGPGHTRAIARHVHVGLMYTVLVYGLCKRLSV